MPISNVLKQVDKITITSLDMRVNEGNGTDEIAQLAITFNKMLERLESSFEVQRSFVSNASHELRTPLTSIKGNIEVSLLKPRENNEYQDILRSTLEDTQNLIELSNRLLDLAKANSDISEISIHKTRVDELIWQTRDWLVERKQDYNVHISFDESVYQDNKLNLLGNEHLFKTAIANLMDNGCKYSPDKSVEVILSVEDDLIVIDFIDKGIGIHSDDLENIFQPFYRASNARVVAGHGLGLSLTDRIVKIHKGHLTITSEVNKGTTVRIGVPYMS
jgi:signal transduction histidine kinase